MKEDEKIDKDFDFARLPKKLWKMRVTVIADVIDLFGTVFKDF